MKVRKYAAVLVLLFMFFAIPLEARADVIPGREMNPFYQQNYEEMINIHVWCYTKAQVSGYSAPGDREAGGHARKGELLLIEALWQDADGIWWGFSQIEFIEGLWLPLSELYVKWDPDLPEEEAMEEEKTREEEIPALSLLERKSFKKRIGSAGTATGMVPVAFGVLGLVWIGAVVIVVRIAKKKR